MEAYTVSRQVRRVRFELKRREVVVARVESIGSNFVGVTFKGDDLRDFVSESFDDHVKFILADPSGEVIRRDYTPRRFDREQGELTIEFALNGDGKASEWVRHATVGQRAVIGGPRGSMIIPIDYDWHLLAGDATALPAMHRRIEELPPGAKIIAAVQVVDATDRREFTSLSALDVQWVHSPQELISAVQALKLPTGEGFAWCAGEASQMAQLRHILAVEKGHPREAMRVAAYWKKGASDYHETLE